MMITVVVYSLVVSVTLWLARFFSLFSSVFFINFLIAILAIVVIVILFTAIVVRIRRNSAQRAALGVGGHDAQHMKAVKMFSLITAFYLLGYVPFGLSKAGVVSDKLKILYFINHICNPIIYFALNDKFRSDIIGLMKRCFPE